MKTHLGDLREGRERYAAQRSIRGQRWRSLRCEPPVISVIHASPPGAVTRRPHIIEVHAGDLPHPVFECRLILVDAGEPRVAPQLEEPCSYARRASIFGHMNHRLRLLVHGERTTAPGSAV